MSWRSWQGPASTSPNATLTYTGSCSALPGQTGYGILRRYRADHLMVYADSPLDEWLKTQPGFSPVDDAPRVKYSLYNVDLEKLGKPAQGSKLPRDTLRLRHPEESGRR